MKRGKRGPGRPRGATSDATRANILRASRICFAAKGFDATTNRDVAEQAGLTAAALYQYFDSKTALYVATARATITEVAADMREQASAEASAATTLSSMVMSLITVHEHDPSRAAFLSNFPNEVQRHPDIARGVGPTGPEVSEITEVLGAIVRRAVAAGEIHENDAGRVAEMFVACMMGLSQYAALKGRGRPVATAFAELLEGRLFARVPRTTRAPKPLVRRPRAIKTRAARY